MRIVCLQHVDYEGPDRIADWAEARGHTIEPVVPLFERFPDTDAFDMLVVMGGPMGAYEEDRYPWLAAEKRFISGAIEAGRRVFGVCLGAQLVAEAIGGRAHPHTVREVGWIPARLTNTGTYSHAFEDFPETFVVGEWHGDTFDLPDGVKSCVETDACANQAFELAGGRVVGVQFHLEWTPETLVTLVQHHGDWLSADAAAGAGAATQGEFLSGVAHLPRSQDLLFSLLDRMEAAR